MEFTNQWFIIIKQKNIQRKKNVKVLNCFAVFQNKISLLDKKKKKTFFE